MYPYKLKLSIKDNSLMKNKNKNIRTFITFSLTEIKSLTKR